MKCPVCGYIGPFKDKKSNRTAGEVREDSKCVRCGASERHRILWLVIEEVLENWDCSGKTILHVAPELCLQKRLSDLFSVYHTSDLFRTDVDFQEDIQNMSFEDGSYDCVFISRVMTSVADLEALVRETRRILKSGGIAIISEAFIHNETLDFKDPRDGWQTHELGMDTFELFERWFGRVERFSAERYSPEFQMVNRIRKNGVPIDDFPEEIRVPGEGYKELVAVCHA